MTPIAFATIKSKAYLVVRCHQQRKKLCHNGGGVCSPGYAICCAEYAAVRRGQASYLFEKGNYLTPRLLPPLPGTVPDGTWMIGTADRAEADGRLAIFAIVTRPTPKSVRLLGTGFYLQLKGGFATAAHVALEAQALLSANSDSVGISHTLPDGRVVFRPIWRFFAHPTADVAFGIPRADIINDRTGEAYRAKVLSLNSTPPELGAAISTWSYPLHRVVGEETTGQFLQLQPDFYNGALEELFTDRGPSVKVMPPYYRTSIHLHGGSSGGPLHL